MVARLKAQKSGQTVWIHVSVLSYLGFVTLGKVFNISGLQMPHL